MFRSRNPPMPQPSRPQDATSSVNYLSAQIQQLLALVLPQPVVALLAAVSDALYRMTLGKSNSPASYTSTLVPPAMLILVTYLATLLVYKSIRSFVGLLIFSLKWFVILGVVGVLLAYHFGNGDVQQGAQQIAQQSGIGGASQASWSDMVRISQKYVPLLSSMPSSVAAATGALPDSQEASRWISQYFQGRNPHAYGVEQNGRRGNSYVREYRDLRPSRQVQETYGNAPQNDGNGHRAASSSRQKLDRTVSNDLRSKKQSDSNVEQAEYFSRFSRWIGADMSNDKDQYKKRS